MTVSLFLSNLVKQLFDGNICIKSIDEEKGYILTESDEHIGLASLVLNDYVILGIDVKKYSDLSVFNQFFVTLTLDRVINEALKEIVFPVEPIIILTGDGVFVALEGIENCSLKALKLLFLIFHKIQNIKESNNIFKIYNDFKIRFVLVDGKILPYTDCQGKVNLIGPGIILTERMLSIDHEDHFLISEKVAAFLSGNGFNTTKPIDLNCFIDLDTIKPFEPKFELNPTCLQGCKKNKSFQFYNAECSICYESQTHKIGSKNIDGIDYCKK